MKTKTECRHPAVKLLLVAAAIAAVCQIAGCASWTPQRPPPVTVSQIIDMTKAGATPQQIIDQINASQTVYRMQATELIKLKEQGVSDDVINYMQQTYLDAVRDEHAYRANYYPPYGYGYYGYGWPWYEPYREVIIVHPRNPPPPKTAPTKTVPAKAPKPVTP